MQPVLAVYAGYSMTQEHVDPGPALDPYVQDAMDEIEHVTDSADTKWGAQRAKDGHPAPFALNFVEIGNEDNFEITLTNPRATAVMPSSTERSKQKYRTCNSSRPLRLTSVKPDIVDDHYCKHAEEFFADVHHYDKADRNGPNIFVGEWATREGGPTPNFGAALGDRMDDRYGAQQ